MTNKPEELTGYKVEFSISHPGFSRVELLLNKYAWKTALFEKGVLTEVVDGLLYNGEESYPLVCEECGFVHWTNSDHLTRADEAQLMNHLQQCNPILAHIVLTESRVR